MLSGNQKHAGLPIQNENPLDSFDNSISLSFIFIKLILFVLSPFETNASEKIHFRHKKKGF